MEKTSYARMASTKDAQITSFLQGGGAAKHIESIVKTQEKSTEFFTTKARVKEMLHEVANRKLIEKAAAAAVAEMKEEEGGSAAAAEPAVAPTAMEEDAQEEEEDETDTL